MKTDDFLSSLLRSLQMLFSVLRASMSSLIEKQSTTDVLKSKYNKLNYLWTRERRAIIMGREKIGEYLLKGSFGIWAPH